VSDDHRLMRLVQPPCSLADPRSWLVGIQQVPSVCQVPKNTLHMQEQIMANKKQTPSQDANRDPITGTPGAHPVATGVGAAVGGAAAGAAAGAVGGPIGAAVGATAGAVAGGLAGKAAGESIDPTVEETYWRGQYSQRPYYSDDFTYEDMAPAYRYGWEARSRYQGRDFDAVESDLRGGWDETQHDVRIGWEEARLAVRDAWDHAETTPKSRMTA
jgi:hypothetical protein